MENKYYQQVGLYYDTDANDFDTRYWQNPVLQEMRQSFREQVKRFDKKSMLEIGCGTGIDLVHFARIFPERKISGIDISKEMVHLSTQKIGSHNLENVRVGLGSVEDIPTIFPGEKFDLIYVFFGALNTVENLSKAAKTLENILDKNGILVLTFVNKWYLGGIFLEIARLHFKKAFVRLKSLWGGYSPVKFLPSKCYSVHQIRNAFSQFELIDKKGYCIVHPAWYYTGINRALGKIRRVLIKADNLLNKTFMWRFGEYSLFVFQK